MRALYLSLVLVTACSLPPLPEEGDMKRSDPPLASLRDGLTMFWPLGESGDGPRADVVGHMDILPWQRLGPAQYRQHGEGTVAVSARVGLGQQIDGAHGYHFARPTGSPLDHKGGSFTWAGWVSINAPGDVGYADQQTLVAKWNSTPDTGSLVDRREYRVWYDPALSQWSFEVSRDGLEGPDHSVAVTHPTLIEPGRLYLVQAWHDAIAGTIHLLVAPPDGPPEPVSAPWAQGVFAGPADLDVGSQNSCTDDHLAGVIDALGHWNRVLSAEESEALLSGFEP
jgi:hypothetical protein